jgi:hypothetical protein
VRCAAVLQSISGSEKRTPHILFSTGKEPVALVRATLGSNPVWEVRLQYGILEVEVRSVPNTTTRAHRHAP